MRQDQIIVNKNVEYAKLQSEVTSGQTALRTQVQQLNRDLEKKIQELAIIKAKLYLGDFSVNLRIVPEYPDMFEEF